MNFNKILFALILLTIIPIYAMASIQIEGSLRHIHKGIKGEVYKGEIKILNASKTDQEVKIYQTDYLYNYKGLTYYDEPITHNRSNADWIEYSPKTVIIKGEQTVYIQYEVSVPDSDTLKGSYWSVIMVEGVNPIDPNQAGQMNINTVTRYAVQIVTEMDNAGEGKLKFLDPTLVKKDDKLYLAVDIVNQGDHYIVPDVSIEFFNEQGESVKTIKAAKKGLLPTTSNRFMFDLEGIESETTYQTTIIAAGEGEDVFGLEYTLYF